MQQDLSCWPGQDALIKTPGKATSHCRQCRAISVLAVFQPTHHSATTQSLKRLWLCRGIGKSRGLVCEFGFSDARCSKSKSVSQTAFHDVKAVLNHESARQWIGLFRDILKSRQNHASTVVVYFEDWNIWSKAPIIVLFVNPKNWCKTI